jgi:azurin
MLAGCGRKQQPEREVVDLYIESDGDFLAFKPDTLTCPRAATVRLTFHHGGKFLSARHNWVLVHAGQMEAVDKDVENNEGIIPRDDKRVIADTPMCDRGVTVMTQFTAPAPGDYPFFCSTPGHGECMNGILRVTG